jgi:hypothetical protein
VQLGVGYQTAWPTSINITLFLTYEPGAEAPQPVIV